MGHPKTKKNKFFCKNNFWNPPPPPPPPPQQEKKILSVIYEGKIARVLYLLNCWSMNLLVLFNK